MHLTPLRVPVKKSGPKKGRKKENYVRENSMLYRNKILGSFAASLRECKSEPDKNQLSGLPGPGKLCQTRADPVGTYWTRPTQETPACKASILKAGTLPITVVSKHFNRDDQRLLCSALQRSFLSKSFYSHPKLGSPGPSFFRENKRSLRGFQTSVGSV